ncbi:DNA repair protein XRCC2 homolog isoform X3 [Capsicum annuum]|uniref:DNA repair protein XRCC2 homolog isoform X3 n=1 Tax=Capsicum annuum TaxID=4072 RepID=UPI001FB139F5|nr:DNA repair protein XRCC2 homolog isoform X3 [Capsicum annuum]
METAKEWIEVDETANQFLTRVFTERPLLILPPPLHRIPLRPGNVVEIVGPSPSSKTRILIQAAINCILPKEWKGVNYGGLERLVMFVDLDCRFDVLSLSRSLKQRIIRANDVAFPTSKGKRGTCIGAFYWMDRGAPSISPGSNNRRSLSLQSVSDIAVQEIQKILVVHPVVVLTTKAASLQDKFTAREVIRNTGQLSVENNLDSRTIRISTNAQLYREYMPSLWQDRSTGQTIGAGHESRGRYHFISSNSFTTCSVIDPPNLIHKRLGHSSLSKLQKMVPSLSSLSTLDRELCQLGKHTRATFSRRIESFRVYFLISSF